MIYKICCYFFYFVLYSVAGWIIETTLYLVRERKIVKRGFLFGPVCPIYGTGAIICNLVLYNRVNNIFLVFLYGALLCGTLEYITHFLMEKLFNAMWWDYSNRRFNIKGRVYLNGILFFGVGATIIVKLLQPLVDKLVAIIPPTVLYSICFALYSIFLIDIVATVIDLRDVIRHIRHLQNFMMENVQKGVDQTTEQLDEFKDTIKNNEYVQSTLSRLHDNAIIKRISSISPNFTIEKYKHILDIIMDKPIEEKARNDIKLYGNSNHLDEKNEK